MKEYWREYPRFSLCGLNCGLCPRYHTGGASRCPGCGGPDFHLQHPSCAIINCSRRHDSVQFCFLCSAYPCDRYRNPSPVDSFISYQNVHSDLEKARQKGLASYMTELDERVAILQFLLQDYNDGRKKNLYCLAVTLLSLKALRCVMDEIDNRVSTEEIDLGRKIGQIVSLLKAWASEEGVELKLRRQQ